MNTGRQDKFLAAIEVLYDCIGDEYDRERAVKTYSQVADDSGVIIADMNIFCWAVPRTRAGITSQMKQ